MAIYNCSDCGGPVRSLQNVCLKCGVKQTQNTATSDSETVIPRYKERVHLQHRTDAMTNFADEFRLYEPKAKDEKLVEELQASERKASEVNLNQRLGATRGLADRGQVSAREVRDTRLKKRPVEMTRRFSVKPREHEQRLNKPRPKQKAKVRQSFREEAHLNKPEVTQQRMSQCIECGEAVLHIAKRCKHCGVRIKLAKPTNHWFHFLMSVVTVGIWVPVWIWRSNKGRRNGYEKDTKVLHVLLTLVTAGFWLPIWLWNSGQSYEHKRKFKQSAIGVIVLFFVAIACVEAWWKYLATDEQLFARAEREKQTLIDRELKKAAKLKERQRREESNRRFEACERRADHLFRGGRAGKKKWISLSCTS